MIMEAKPWPYHHDSGIQPHQTPTLELQLLISYDLRNMLIGVMVDVVGTTAQMEQEEQSLKTLKRDIADVAP